MSALGLNSVWPFIPFSNRGADIPLDGIKLDEAIQYTLKALAEDSKGESDMALEFYFEALSSMLDALPVSKDPKKNKLMNVKLISILQKKFHKVEMFNEQPMPRRVLSESNLKKRNSNDMSLNSNTKENDGKSARPTTLSDRVVRAAVAGAVALKQSPIPDAVMSTVSYTLSKAQAIDKYIGVQNMCWEVSKAGLNKALELDEQYQLHEKVSAAIMTSATAVIRAGIAYQEAKSYRDLREGSKKD